MNNWWQQYLCAQFMVGNAFHKDVQRFQHGTGESDVNMLKYDASTKLLLFCSKKSAHIFHYLHFFSCYLSSHSFSFWDVTESSSQLTVYHGYLASSYHTGIISGIMLISSYMESMASNGKMVSIFNFHSFIYLNKNDRTKQCKLLICH